MRVLLSVLLLVMMVLAGCAEKSGGEAGDGSTDEALDGGQDGGDQTGSDTGGVGGGNATQGGQEAVNQTVGLPTALLSAAVVNGTAPLLVNFTIEGENATSWFLDFGDGNATDGATFPGQANHTFAAGVFNVTLLVQGEGGNATQNLTITVEAAIAEDLGPQPFTMTVDLESICPGCKAGTSTCVWRQSGGATPPDCAWIDFGPGYEGQPFTLTGTGLDPDGLFWNNGCNEDVGLRVSSNLSEESGTIPPGATCILVWEAFDPLVTVTFTITPQ